MENLNQKIDLSESEKVENTESKKENEGNEYEFTKIHKEKAKDTKEEIKKLMEKNEKLKKLSDDASK